MESTSAKTPADFLKSIRGKRVVVKLNSGVDYRGTQPPRSYCYCYWVVVVVVLLLLLRENFLSLFLSLTTTTETRDRVCYCYCYCYYFPTQRWQPRAPRFSFILQTGILACLDGYMNIAMEHTEVSAREGENRPNTTTTRVGRTFFFSLFSLFQQKYTSNQTSFSSMKNNRNTSTVNLRTNTGTRSSEETTSCTFPSPSEEYAVFLVLRRRERARRIF